MTTKTDVLLMEQAEDLYKEEKILEAARLLQRVQDISQLTDFHHRLLRNARLCEEAVSDLLSSPTIETTTQPATNTAEDGWKKQGESHGKKYDSKIYYKVEEGSVLRSRIETPIPPGLLVPLLSVLNESSLYSTWIPSWTYPMTLGIRRSEQLIQDTRGHQIIQIQCDVPWPMKAREVLMDVVAVDDIDARGFIVAKMTTLSSSTNPGNLPEGFSIPTVEDGTERIDFDGALLFRACPKDYYSSNNNNNNNNNNNSDELLLVQFTCTFDAHMGLVPLPMINFVTRTVIGQVWAMLLQVAEEVRDGTRPKHKEAIEAKQEFYKWVEDRTQTMISRNNSTNTTATEEDAPWTLPEVLALAS